MLANSLAEYEIDSSPEALAQAALHRITNSLPEREFFDQAGFALETFSAIAQEEIIPHLEEYEATWHPSGFMVFHLGIHPTLGNLRFHVWPKGLRVREDRGRGNLYMHPERRLWLPESVSRPKHEIPDINEEDEALWDIWDGDIHDHAWHVIAEVITGYQDNVYRMGYGNPSGAGFEKNHEITDRDIALAGVFHAYMISYYPGGLVGMQRLRAGGIFAIPTPRGKMQDGDLHLLAAGEFHAPAIPDDELAATVVLNSHRVQLGPHILMGGSLFNKLRTRPVATLEEKLLAKTQLMAHLSPDSPEDTSQQPSVAA